MATYRNSFLWRFLLLLVYNKELFSKTIFFPFLLLFFITNYIFNYIHSKLMMLILHSIYVKFNLTFNYSLKICLKSNINSYAFVYYLKNKIEEEIFKKIASRVRWGINENYNIIVTWRQVKNGVKNFNLVYSFLERFKWYLHYFFFFIFYIEEGVFPLK